MLWEIIREYSVVIQTIALVATLIVVSLYTYFTNKIRKATERQVDLTLQPIVAFVYEERDSKFKLINYGKTPALRIEFSEISLIKTKELKMKYLISSVDYLPPGAKSDVEIKLKINGEIKNTDTFDRGALDPKSAHRPFEVKITYRNAINDKIKLRGKLGTKTFIIDNIKKMID